MGAKKLLAVTLVFSIAATGIPLSGIGVDVQAANNNSAIFKGEEWFDQNDVFQVNREDAHASFIGFDNINSAKNPELRKKHETSPYYQSLNGTWKFEWVKSPHERNMEFYKDSYDTSSWQNIKVPANWQTENYDSPKYTDTRLPWEGV